MHKILLKLADAFRTRYDPSPLRRAEVIRLLAQRPPLSHEEWHRRFAGTGGIPLQFIVWFRDTCSRCFGYDLSGALPEDRLVDDLGARDATWGDLDLDLLQEYQDYYGTPFPTEERTEIITFGELLNALWSHAREHSPRLSGRTLGPDLNL